MKPIRSARALIGLLLLVGLSACGFGGDGVGIVAPPRSGSTGELVGVDMPTAGSDRWINDGENIKALLEKLGYRVDLQYAGDDVRTQVNQLEYQMTQGAKLLIVAAVDGTGLTAQLQEAAEKKIPVIAYDRLIRNSPNVNYYTSFDNYKVGAAQATSLLTGLGVINADGSRGDGEGPFNIEIFAGSSDDNNATFVYNGAMDVLKPYLDSGDIVVKSGQTDFKTVSTPQWKAAPARKRLDGIISKSYTGRAKLHGVLCPNDDIASGVIGASKAAGYGTEANPYPIITGQDGTISAVKSVMTGEQYSTIFKDTRELAKVTVKMAEDILGGKTPTTNNTKDYDNGTKVVPAYLLQGTIVTKANYKKVLLDSGYYTTADLA